jgi:hypothetical protein
MTMIEIKNASTLSTNDIKQTAKTISDKHPGKYIVLTATFGLFAEIRTNLNVFAPDDSYFNWYVLNGKIKNFTSKQKIAAQNATPTMS